MKRPTVAAVKAAEAAAMFNAGTIATMQQALREAATREALLTQRLTKCEKRYESLRSDVAVTVRELIHANDMADVMPVTRRLNDALMSSDPNVTKGH